MALRLDSEKDSSIYDGVDVEGKEEYFLLIRKEMHTYGKLRKYRKA